MFGHDWEQGTAKVIDRELISSGGGETPGQHRYVVEVENLTGEPFRAEIQDPGFRGRSYVVAHVGEEVAVLIDRKRQKAKLDQDDPSRHSDPKAIEHATKARLEAELAAAPGTAPEQAEAKAPRITVNGKVFDGPMDKAGLQKALGEAGSVPTPPSGAWDQSSRPG
jgi:hypothetical protein